MNRLIVIAWALLWLATPGFAQKPAKPKRPQELVIATYAYHTNSRINNLLPLSTYLSQKLDINVRTVSYKTVPDLIAAVRASKVDIAFPNTFGYLSLIAEPAPVVPLAVMALPDTGPSQYSGCILVHKNTGITTPEQLRSKAHNLRLTFTSSSSTSGALVQRYFFNSLGLNHPEKQFKQVNYSGTHTAAAKQVAAGTTDLAALGTNEYYRLVSQKEIDPGQVTVLWVSPEIPFAPVLCRNTLPLKLQNKLQQSFLTLHQKDKAAYKAIQAGWVEAVTAPKYVPVQPQKYQSLAALVASGGSVPDTNLVGNK